MACYVISCILCYFIYVQCSVLKFIMLLAIGSLCFKVHSLSKVVATLLLTSHSSEGVRFTLPPTPMPTSPAFGMAISWSHIHTILLTALLITLLAALLLLYLRYSRSPAPCSDSILKTVRLRVTLVVSSVSYNIMIPLVDVPMTNKAPVLNLLASQISLHTSFLRPILDIQWTAFSLSQVLYDLPTINQCPLNFLQYLTLRRILSDKHCVHVLAISHADIHSLCSWSSQPSPHLISKCPSSPPLYPSLDNQNSPPTFRGRSYIPCAGCQATRQLACLDSGQSEIQELYIVGFLRDEKGGYCADLSTSMKFGMNVVQNMLNSFFEGAKLSAHCGHHIGQSKMAAAHH